MKNLTEPPVFGEWQPIDSAPKGVQLLVHDGTAPWLASFDGIDWEDADGDVSGEPTHWMPLPAAPTSKEETP